MRIAYTTNYCKDYWEKSDENLLLNTKHPLFVGVASIYSSHSELYIMNLVRNMLGSVVSYKIIDIEKNNENQTSRATFSLLGFGSWESDIETALTIFYQEIQKHPQVILMNETTISKIERRLPKDKNIIETIEHKNGSISIIVDKSLSDHDYCLVYDENEKIE